MSVFRYTILIMKFHRILKGFVGARQHSMCVIKFRVNWKISRDRDEQLKLLSAVHLRRGQLHIQGLINARELIRLVAEVRFRSLSLSAFVRRGLSTARPTSTPSEGQTRTDKGQALTTRPSMLPWSVSIDRYSMYTTCCSIEIPSKSRNSSRTDSLRSQIWIWKQRTIELFHEPWNCDKAFVCTWLIN